VKQRETSHADKPVSWRWAADDSPLGSNVDFFKNKETVLFPKKSLLFGWENAVALVGREKGKKKGERRVENLGVLIWFF